MQIYLKFSYRNTLLNLPVKKCLMIFRTESLMNDVHDLVRQNLPGFTDPSTRPYVMNHGGLGPITQQNIIDRKDEINLFLSTRYISGIKLLFFPSNWPILVCFHDQLNFVTTFSLTKKDKMHQQKTGENIFGGYLLVFLHIFLVNLFVIYRTFR